MQLRGRSKDADDGASTSTRAPSVVSQKEEYVFPERLIKDKDWRKMAILNKCDKETTSSINLALVFDFFNKFSDAFNLTKISEEELDETIVASADSLGSHILVRMVVELICGFTSIDCTHQMRMYHRNRIYRETNEENYNISLWEFFDHDWKIFTRSKMDLRNFFGFSKETADVFAFEPRVRAAVLYDLCQYRLACLDAQDVIDSVIDESESPMGDQLRTVPFGGFGDEKYYYLGGIWVYRWRLLSTKTSKRNVGLSTKKGESANIAKRMRRGADDRRSQGGRDSPRNQKGMENGVMKKEGSDRIETEKSEGTEADIVNDDSKERFRKASDEESIALEDSGKGDGLIRESRPVLIEKMNGFVQLQKENAEADDNENLKAIPLIDNGDRGGAVEDLDPEEYFDSLRDKNFLWEVVCRNEDHLHFLIEYFRESHKVGHSAMAKTLIDVVLPSVLKILQALQQKIAEKKKSRFMPVETNGLYAGNSELRHSRRLEQKRIEREKRLEEERKLEMELENQLREEEWKRAVFSGTNLPAEITKQLSREERARLREQRIEQYNLARRLKMERKEQASEEKSDMLKSLEDGENSGIRMPAMGTGKREFVQLANSKAVSLQSVETSGHFKGGFYENLSGQKILNGISEAQMAMTAYSTSFQRPKGQSFLTANEPVAGTSFGNVASSSDSWQQFGGVSDHYHTAVWNKRRCGSTGEGASPMRSNKSEILQLGDMDASTTAHNVPFVGQSFHNIYDGYTGTLPRQRHDLHGCSYYESASGSVEPGCSDEDADMSSARTRPVDWMYRKMRSVRQPQPDACDTSSASLPWQSGPVGFNEQTQTGNEVAPSQETRPASADFYKTARVLSHVDENALSSVGNNSELHQEESTIDKGFVDYPAFKDGQLRWFRIVEPVGTRIILQRDEPLKEHDYFMPTIEQIVANEWKFSVEPVDETSSIEKTEFLLQFGQQIEEPQQSGTVDDANFANAFSEYGIPTNPIQHGNDCV